MTNQSDILKWIWLSELCNYSPTVINHCLTVLGMNPVEMYDSGINIFKDAGCAGKRFSRSLEKANKTLEAAIKSGLEIITCADDEYPDRLRHIYCPPLMLFVKGTLPDLDNLLPITMVGSREVSLGGKISARKIALEIARAGAIVISGLALGTDVQTHIGALIAGQKTVAVLAGGADVIYPKRNKVIYDLISETSAIISEMPPGTKNMPHLFRQRNRIISGLSVGTVIVEGSVNTGTSLTANWAIEQNKDIFAVPTSPSVKNSNLTFELLKDGATPVVKGSDIISFYQENSTYMEYLELGKQLIDRNLSKEAEKLFPKIDTYPSLMEQKIKKSVKSIVIPKREKKNREPKTTTLPETYKNVSGIDADILKCLYDEGGEAHIDKIILSCNSNSNNLNAHLLSLEMRHLVELLPGKVYRLI